MKTARQKNVLKEAAMRSGDVMTDWKLFDVPEDEPAPLKDASFGAEDEDIGLDEGFFFGDEEGSAGEDDPDEQPVDMRKRRSIAENSRRLAENIKRREQEALEAEIAKRGEKDIFGEYENDVKKQESEISLLIADAEKRREKNRSKKEKKLETEKKKEKERDEVWDHWLRRPSFYVAFGAVFTAFLVLVIGAVATAATSSRSAVTGGLTEVHDRMTTDSDGTSIYSILGSYRDFLAHDAGVRKAAAEQQQKDSGDDPVLKPTPSPKIEETPFIMPTEIPSADTPQPTSGGKEGSMMLSTSEDYYVFDLGPDGYKTRHLNIGDRYTYGYGTDNAGRTLLVATGGNDLEYGCLRIQNPYDAPGFELKDVLDSPLLIRRFALSARPVILYYTHTSEGYCLTEAERKVSSYPSISGYDRTRNVVGRGEIFKRACEAVGVGVAVIEDVNDTEYDRAYDVSREAVNTLAARNADAQLSIDIHSNAFLYPAGMRYAPTVTKDDKQYAKILFVVTQNEQTNPLWRENIKLAMLLIEKLEEEVPGITLGISLRKDSKYNTSATKFGLLVELGFEGNLVSEADLSAELLGRVVGNALIGNH